MSAPARIAVIGAGPAGLSAAYYLQEAGYEHVTVFEAAPEVGGKCLSIPLDGRVYELGAVLVSPAYEHTLPLLEMLDLHLDPAPAFWVVDARTGASRPGPTLDPEGPDPGQARADQELILGWLKALRQHKDEVGRPGYRRVSPAIARPFGPWARERGLGRLTDLFSIPLTAFGYGSLEVTPAAYVMKNMSRRSFLRSPGSDRDWWIVREGYQALCRRLGARLRDLRTGTPVVSVTRGDGIVLRATGPDGAVEERFDAVILATPLDARGGLGFLELDADERRLFSLVEYYDYVTTLARVPGLPAGRCYASTLDGDTYVEPPEGAPCLFSNPHPEGDGAVFYTLPAPGVDEAGIEAQISALMARMGHPVEGFVEHRRWRYFPHVGEAAMAAGWFDEVEALQGRRGTYYAGGQLDFDIVEGAVSYSRALVDRHFRR